MNKIERRFNIEYDFEWEWGVEISKIRADLDALEKLGATHIEVEGGESYDCPYVKIEGYVDRIETDEEYLQRTGEQEAREEEHKRRELDQLERLKKKYEE